MHVMSCVWMRARIRVCVHAMSVPACVHACERAGGCAYRVWGHTACRVRLHAHVRACHVRAGVRVGARVSVRACVRPCMQVW